MTAGTWSGLAAPVVAGAAVHSTAPWYIAVPVLAVALALTIWRPAGAAGAAGRRAGTVRRIVRAQAMPAMGTGNRPGGRRVGNFFLRHDSSVLLITSAAAPA